MRQMHMNRRNLSAVLMLFFLSSAVMAGEPAPRKNAAVYEVRFMKNMIDHHMMAVMTGELCTERALHDELAELCHEIVTTQVREIELMQDWLQDWYGISYVPQMSQQGERTLEELSELYGEEFEIAFMQMMIEHHEGALKEGRKCMKKAWHEELVNLCHSIVESQTAEIELMEGWLCDWYEICPRD